jgi:hypothetical protein
MIVIGRSGYSARATWPAISVVARTAAANEVRLHSKRFGVIPAVDAEVTLAAARGRAEACDRSLEHVKSREGCQQQPPGRDEPGQHNGKQHHHAGKR